jgi:DNA polymerase III delta subunit
VIYERKLLPPDSPLLTLPAKIQAFPLAVGINIFAWGDQVGQRQVGPALKSWQKLREAGEDEEYLFLMLVRQFRLLILTKRGHSPKGPDFVREKIAAQARLWSEEELRSVYRKLLEIDRRHKTGLAALEVGMTELLSLIGKKVEAT